MVRSARRRFGTGRIPARTGPEYQESRSEPGPAVRNGEEAGIRTHPNVRKAHGGFPDPTVLVRRLAFVARHEAVQIRGHPVGRRRGSGHRGIVVETPERARVSREDLVAFAVVDADV